LSKDKKLLCFDFAEKIDITQSAQSVGGNATNVAVGIRTLGKQTALVTEIGDDIYGEQIMIALKKTKVATDFVRIKKHAQTRYSVILNFNAERTILAYHSPHDYTFPSLPESEWIYYSSLGKNFERLQNKLYTHLKKHPNTKLAMNPGTYQLKHGLKKIYELFPFTAILFVNKQEAERIVGKQKNIKLLLQKLQKTGVAEVIVTDGEQGSYSYDGESYYHMPMYPIHAIAKTGAGDAYTSGYLAGRMYNHDIATAMCWGSANAAMVTQKFGAQQGLCKKKSLLNIIHTYNFLKPKQL